MIMDQLQELIYRHRLHYSTLTCQGGDWTHDGVFEDVERDHAEHLALVIRQRRFSLPIAAKADHAIAKADEIIGDGDLTVRILERVFGDRPTPQQRWQHFRKAIQRRGGRK